MAKLKVQEATVDDGSSYHDLLKDEQKRFQESRAPKMSELTTEDFAKLVGGGSGAGSVGFTLDDIRQVVKEEVAAALDASKPESVSPERTIEQESGEAKKDDASEAEQPDRVVKQELSDAASSTAEPAKGKAK